MSIQRENAIGTSCVVLRAEDALSKCEVARSELQMEMSRTRLESAGLRDALNKLQNINEALEHDKIELNKTLAQVPFISSCKIQ